MKRGFTLLEMILVLAVIAVVSGILLGAFASFREASQLTETHSSIIGILKDARSRTLASKGNSNHGVHFEEIKTVLFKGSTYSSSDPSNEIYLLPAGIKISSINLTGGAADTVFTRLLGTTTASGKITITSKRDSGQSKTIDILSTGVIE